MRIFIGQFGQVSSLFSFSGGRGMISSWVTDKRALAVRRADAVGAGVAAADDDDVLAAGEDRHDVAERLVADAPVLLGQELHGEMDAVELAAGDRQVARLLGAAGERDGIVAVQKLGDVELDADMDVAMEGDALGLHLGDAPLDVRASPS